MINWEKYAPYITPAECACSCPACGIDSAENSIAALGVRK